MKPARTLAILLIVCSLVSVAPALRAGQAGPVRSPLGMADILAWKNIGAAIVSDDGRWLAYRLSPVEGDGEVVLRETRGDKEWRFGAGEVTGGAGELVFSEDSRWLAFSVAPTRKEAAQLKKQRKPLQNKVSLVDVSTGKANEFPKIKRVAFSGERAGWVALHRYAAESQVPEKDRPKGSDLILRDLASGSELNIGNVADFAFDKAGRWLAWTIDAVDQAGNGLAVRDLASGQVLPLDSAKASFERPTWTEKGDALAAVRGVEDKAYVDKLYSLVAFNGFGAGAPAKAVYDPAADKEFPAGMTISADRAPAWMDDHSGVLIGIRPAKKKADEKGSSPVKTGEAAEAAGAKDPKAQDPKDEKPKAEADSDPEEKPDLVLWHYQDPRLQSQQQVEEDRDKRFSFLAIYRPQEKKFVRLATEEVREVIASPRARWALGLDNSTYQLTGSMDGRRFQDVYAIDLATGARTLAASRVRWFSGPSPDASRFLYFEDGHYFAYDVAAGKAVNLTQGLPVAFVDTRDDHNVVKPPTPALGWSLAGDAVLLSDGWDLWRVPVAGGPATNLTVNGRKDQVRYQRRLSLDRDERGIDFGQPMLVTVLGDWTKKGGVARIDPGKPGARPLLWDDAMFARVMKAQKADVYVYSRETLANPPDLYVADASLAGGRKLTALDAQLAKHEWSAGAMLVDYKPAQKMPAADRLQAALYLPANYEKGKSYPTIVYIYERLSQDFNRFTAPTANGFNKSVYTSNGYAVLMPDITYKLNDPGRSAAWCVLPALEAAIATGVVDRARVGLQGHSWGGYQTSFLVTQTNAFAAAVAGAPLTNMVSMYSLIYKNSGNTNQGIFESSQGRFLGGYWDNWEAYYRNSPVFFARSVKTPLMILHNDKDGAVDFTQGVEYFNTLRRLGKPVWMLEYVGENHGLRKPANMQDYTVRMREFFDHYLKGQPMAGWMKDGVSRLAMEDHLKDRAPLLKGVAPGEPAKTNGKIQ
ncbi:MAG TPA: prolyl oligopeptidase family serine peptidase [Vicinamibacterales bacterium]|nr:prolyl oligopeptidase family serine peptidase [Vicinamibacterales bacterium]